MSATLVEHGQYVDSSGAPLVGGSLFIGDKDQDPELNPKSIFSDRELTVSLSNPQTLDSNGRSTNKIWTDGTYSIKVEDLNSVQVYQELDNGESSSTGTTTLENVSGANNITADATSTIIAYVDQEVYSLKIASPNTGAVDLNIDAVGASSVVKNNSLAIVDGDFELDQIVRVVYNITSDTFIWINQKLKTLPMYEGAAIASAATTEIWATDGQTVHITGTTTITSFGTAPNIGAWRRLIFDGAVILTDGANLNLPGGQNILTEANDFAFVYADTTTLFRVLFFPVDGANVLGDFARSYLAGLQLSQAADTDHDITVAAGQCRSADNDADIDLSAITKQIDASWTAGDAAGGLSSSLTVANDTWYHVHAIVVGGLPDVGFDTSVTAANLVADHSATSYRRLLSVLTDGSANISTFLQVGDHVYWGAFVQDYSADPGTATVTTTITVPIDVRVDADISVRSYATLVANNEFQTSIYPAELTQNTLASIVGYVPGSSSTFTWQAITFTITTNTSGEISHKTDSTDIELMQIYTRGWIDSRGRND